MSATFEEDALHSASIGFLARLTELLPLVPGRSLAQALSLLLRVHEAGKRVYAIGNGGSAATASHLVCDFLQMPEGVGCRPIRAVALADSAAVITAVANDRGYSQLFDRRINALVEAGDVVVAISVSGQSPNVVQGLSAAKAMGAHTIGLLGGDGGDALKLADVAIHVASDDAGLVETVHLAIVHAMAAALRASLGGAHSTPV